MSTPTYTIACVPGALPGGLTRTSLFDGMVLTRADVDAEQLFWRLKRSLTNRALGQGVVWGLRLTYTGARFQLSRGYALDCCGNDLIVTDPYEVRQSDLIDLTDPAVAGLLGQSFKFYETNALKLDGKQSKLAVMLKYVECPESPRMLHKDPCTPDTSQCQTSRVRETTKLIVGAPPPPLESAPLVNFLESLDTLRTQAASTPTVQAAIFPDDAPPTKGTLQPLPNSGIAQPPPGNGVTISYLPLELHVRLGDVERVMQIGIPFGRSVFGGISMKPIEILFPVPAQSSPPATATLSFELRATSGYVLTKGTAQINSSNNLGTAGSALPNVTMPSVTPPFDSSLGWNIQFALPVTGDQTTSVANLMQSLLQLTLEDITYAPLFGGDAPMRTSITVSGNVGFTVVTAGANQSAASVHTFLSLSAQVRDRPEAVPVPSRGQQCPVPFDPTSLLLKGESGNVGVVILAALYSWLKQAMSGENVKNAAAFDGQRTLAAWIYLAAWRLLFGVDAAGDPDGATNTSTGDREALAALLQTLLGQWCDGFMYPGPRCVDKTHGVVLGTVTLDGAGNVVSFDPWEGRRYVITGPLLAHWGAQLGLAPLDVIAARFAQSVCCARKIDPEMPTLGLPKLETPNVPIFNVPAGGQVTATQAYTGGILGTLASDGFFLGMGKPLDTYARLTADGVNIAATKQVSSLKLVELVVKAFSRAITPTPAQRSYTLYSIDGESSVSSLHLVLIDDTPAASPTWEQQRQRVREWVVLAAPPAKMTVAEDALRDLVVELLYQLSLRQLTIALPTSVTPAQLAQALDTWAGQHVTSIGHALGIGGDQLVRLLGNNFTNGDTVSDLVTTAAGNVAQQVMAATRSVAAASTTTVTRTTMRLTPFQQAEVAALVKALTSSLTPAPTTSLLQPLVTDVANTIAG